MRETVRRVVKSLRRSPGFVAIATVSIGLSLGIATSIFALMDAMTHPSPPFRDIGQLYGVMPRLFAANIPPADSVYAAIGALDGVERYATSRRTYEQFAILGGRAHRVGLRWVGVGAFDILGLRPRLGRFLTPSDHDRGDVAVVSDMVWRRDFANRDEIGDASVTIGDHLFTVIGVMPPGADRGFSGEVFLPDTAGRREWGGLLVRVKPGVTRLQLEQRVRALGERYTAAYAGPKDRGFRAGIGDLQPDPVRLRDFHYAMFGAAICVLIIGCANIAALMLARGMVRSRDYALRLALGARPAGIASEVILEVTLLAFVGCAAGVFVTSWVVNVLGNSMPAEMYWEGFAQPQWSWRVLALAAVAVASSVAVAGGYPAWRAGRTDPAGPLKEGAATNTGRSHTRFRWLVVGELAVAMMLLVCSSLMLKSVRQIRDFRFGYPAERLMYVSVYMPWRQDSVTPAQQGEIRRQGLDFVRAVDGVAAAIPLYDRGRPPEYTTIISDRTVEGGPSISVRPSERGSGLRAVGAEYFTTVGIPLASGRDFAPGDEARGGAVILDEKTAVMLFPHESGVGHLIKLGDLRSSRPWLPVVGIVRNHALNFDPYPELGADTSALVYAMLPEVPAVNRKGQPRGTRDLAFLVRTAGDPDAMQLKLARAVAAITPAGGTGSVAAWTEYQQQQLRVEGFTARIFLLLGVASLSLGAAGLFSVISYIAGQRRREYAVRIALGATMQNVARLVMREAFLMAIGGTGIGAAFGMWAGFLIWTRLWNVYPVDVEALVLAELVLVATTMAACLVPALRASRSDPVEVMRAT